MHASIRIMHFYLSYRHVTRIVCRNELDFNPYVAFSHFLCGDRVENANHSSCKYLFLTLLIKLLTSCIISLFVFTTTAVIYDAINSVVHSDLQLIRGVTFFYAQNMIKETSVNKDTWFVNVKVLFLFDDTADSI